MIKVLAFGYLPKSKGGKQTSGLATGIFGLHNAENSLSLGIQTIIVATDVHYDRRLVDNTLIIGWNKTRLVRYICIRPIKFFYFLFEALKLCRFRSIISFPLVLAKLIYLDYGIYKIKPDVIHFHGSVGALLSRGLWDKNLKKVLRLHGINAFDEFIPNRDGNEKIERYITTLEFNVVNFVSNKIYSDWQNVYGQFNCPMKVVLNGYNENVFSFEPDELEYTYDLVTFSAISQRKGQERVIEALKLLKNLGHSFKYLIIGDGESKYVQNLKDYVMDSDIDVTFIDYLAQEEVSKYLKRCRFFILPSSSEGFGQVFIESIASGVPVIIPSDIPLVMENNVITEVNSILMNDSSVDSIVKVLFKFNDYMDKFDRNKVARSVNHLRWSYIADIYVNQIYKSI